MSTDKERITILDALLLYYDTTTSAPIDLLLTLFLAN